MSQTRQNKIDDLTCARAHVKDGEYQNALLMLDRVVENIKDGLTYTDIADLYRSVPNDVLELRAYAAYMHYVKSKKALPRHLGRGIFDAHMLKGRSTYAITDILIPILDTYNDKQLLKAINMLPAEEAKLIFDAALNDGHNSAIGRRFNNDTLKNTIGTMPPPTSTVTFSEPQTYSRLVSMFASIFTSQPNKAASTEATPRLSIHNDL